MAEAGVSPGLWGAHSAFPSSADIIITLCTEFSKREMAVIFNITANGLGNVKKYSHNGLKSNNLEDISIF